MQGVLALVLDSEYYRHNDVCRHKQSLEKIKIDCDMFICLNFFLRYRYAEQCSRLTSFVCFLQ